jgi:4-amino-4-deoxy-L-arabinose transferase-like glycosyltransferase
MLVASRRSNMEVASPSRLPLGWLALVVSIGLGLRLFPVLWYGNSDGLYLAADADSWGYHRLASNLLAGRGYTWDQELPSAPNLYRPPGFPLILLGLYTLTTPWFVAAVVLQALVGSVVILLTFVLARRLGFSPRVALIAAGAQALDPVAIHYCNALMTEVYTSVLLLAAAGCVARYQQSPRPVWLLSAGGLLSAGILIHPILLFLPLLLLAVPLLTPGTRTRRQFAVALAAVVLALAPASAWVVRNWHVGDFVGISSVEAVNLLKYKAAGVEAELRGTSREVERDRLARECDAELPPGATPGDRLRLWRRRGIAILLAHPLVYAKIHAQGMLVEMFGPERDQTTRLLYGRATLGPEGRCTDASIAAARSRPVPALEAVRFLILGWQVVLGLGLLAGACWMARRRPWLLAVLLVVPLYVLALSGGPEGSPRFRVIYLPALSLLTGVGAQAALNLWSAGRRWAGQADAVPSDWTRATRWPPRKAWRQGKCLDAKPKPRPAPGGTSSTVESEAGVG